MAQTAYTGIQGSGKSYEVVRGVIVPNYAKGRRIVTNVAGLKDDLIADYCVDVIGCERENLGEIVHISNEDVTKENFFPKEGQDNSGCIVQPGDIIILDECWRWYVTGERLPDGHLTFFRMHRHFIDPESGVSCDIVLIVQDIDDLQRKIRATIEKSFLMQKHKDLGMPDRYVVNIYSGNRQTKSALIQSFQESYKPEIFALYSSYSQAAAGAASPKEQQADSRGNFFANWRIRYGLPVSVALIVLAVWRMWVFFHPEPVKPSAGASSGAGAATASAGSPSVAAPEKPRSSVDSDWRVVGWFESGGSVTAVLENGAGAVRYLVNPPNFRLTSLDLQVALPTGEIVTRWSGQQRGKGAQ